MVVTELKTEFQKLKPHIVAYRDYKHFDNEKFRSDIQNFASQKNVKCFKETIIPYLTSMLLLKEGMSVLMRLPL